MTREEKIEQLRNQLEHLAAMRDRYKQLEVIHRHAAFEFDGYEKDFQVECAARCNKVWVEILHKRNAIYDELDITEPLTDDEFDDLEAECQHDMEESIKRDEMRGAEDWR